MTDQGSDRHPIDLLAEEFTERLRRGEEPSVDAYASSHPRHAEEIRGLFPAIAEMERLKRRKERSGEPPAFPEGFHPQRLGDYRIVQEIGRGGMGIVYEAEQESLGRRVAIKVLPRHLLPDSKGYQRFDREARTAARLHHTNIVPVFGVGEQDGYRYFVMQYIAGVGLDEVLRELQRLGGGGGQGGERSPSGPWTARRAEEAARIAREVLGGRLGEPGEPREPRDPAQAVGPGTIACATPSPSSETAAVPPADRDAEAAQSPDAGVEPASPRPSARRRDPGYWRCLAEIGLQAASALQYAHSQGTLHRDIKPANLLLDAQGFVWVGDFGLAKPMDDHEISQTGDVVGTLRYMAPEQLSGRTDERSDVYGLGLTLYELATLRPAYREPDTKRLIRAISDGQLVRPRKLCPEMPADLETIVLKCIDREPAHRYRSAGDLRADLQRFLDDLPIHARSIGPVERLWRWSRRNRALAAALVLLILLLGVATAAFMVTKRAKDAESRSSALALGALDKIFDQFAPNRSVPASSLTLGESESESIEVPIPPVLSRPAARLLENLLGFYNSLAEEKGGDAKLRRKAADANRRVGDIHQRLRNHREARAAYQRALAAYETLPETTPGGDPRIEAARIQNELGTVSQELGEPGRPFFLKALEILEPLAAASTSPEMRFELARTHFFLGKFWMPGPGPGGPGGPDLGLFKALERKKDRRPRGSADRPPERPADAAPSSPRPGLTPGPDLPPEGGDEKRGPRDRRRGPGEWEQGLREQRSHLKSAVEILEALLGENPRYPEGRQLLARSYRELGKPGPGQPEPGSFDRAREILEKLVADFPANPDYRYDLSKLYADRGSPRPRWGEPAGSEETTKEAIGFLEKALQISEDLVADQPHVPNYAVSQVDFRLKLAMVLRVARRLDPAETNLAKALELQSALVRRYPEVESYKVAKAGVQRTLAELLWEENRLEEAWFILEESVSMLEASLASTPEAPQQGWTRFLLSGQWMALAQVLFDLGAEEWAAEAWARAEEFSPLFGGPAAGGPGPIERR